FFSLHSRRPRPPLFPYTTLFRSSGSFIAATTRAIPACFTASTHGGVRPVWAHGSRFVYRVAPRAAAPALRIAFTSAWGSPAAWRSEEHTSELQSRGHLVCRLLLE